MSAYAALKPGVKPGIRGYKPSRAEEKYIADARGFLTMTAPFWSHILYAELPIVYTDDVPLAGTDGRRIYVNVPNMQAAGWGLEEVAFVLAHEVMHYVYGDLMQAVVWRRDRNVMVSNGKTLPYVHPHMNRSQDYRINAALIEAKVGKFPKIGLFNPKISEKGMESSVSIYEKTWKDCGSDAANFDEHLEPDEEAKPIDDLRKVQVIAGAIQAHAASGKGELPASLRVLVGEILEPKVDWNDKLRAQMLRAAGQPGLNWKQLNKRLIARPERIAFARRSHYGCGTVVIAIDTSGSVFEKTGEFLSEANGIVQDLNPERVLVIWCDAKIGRVDDLDEPGDLLDLHRRIQEEDLEGGGGTKFEPVFEYLADEGIHPDMLVYLTDTYGTFPKAEPDYKVIWGSIVEGGRVPFGELIHVEIE